MHSMAVLFGTYVASGAGLSWVQCCLGCSPITSVPRCFTIVDCSQFCVFSALFALDVCLWCVVESVVSLGAVLLIC